MQKRRLGNSGPEVSAKVALAWLMAQRPYVVPIPGTSRLSGLEENLGALALELDAEDLALLDRLTREIAIQGGRFPDFLERRTGL
jgi:aryl-alcohol dehydrogenase-like predicted oxidoreductase